MANTYSQLYLHFVFAAKHRSALIAESIRSRVEGYMASVARAEGHYVHALYAMPDHVHLLVGYSITQSIPDFVRLIKAGSSKWINEEGLTQSHFNWQEGYGVFSHGPDSLENVKTYILSQPDHHQKRSFQEEYLAFLRRYKVEFDERYVFSMLE